MSKNELSNIGVTCEVYFVSSMQSRLLHLYDYYVKGESE